MQFLLFFFHLIAHICDLISVVAAKLFILLDFFVINTDPLSKKADFFLFLLLTFLQKILVFAITFFVKEKFEIYKFPSRKEYNTK